MKRLANLGLSLMLTGLVAIALAVAIVPSVTETRAVTIDRNSMQAILPMGSLAYIQAKPTYDVGDIVTYVQNGHVITHQIVELLPNPATAKLDGSRLQTKGTGNIEPDPYTIHRDQIIGEVVYFLPVAGIALKVIGTPVVQVFLGLLALSLYLLSKGTTFLNPIPQPGPAATLAAHSPSYRPWKGT